MDMIKKMTIVGWKLSNKESGNKIINKLIQQLHDGLQSYVLNPDEA